MYYQRTTEKKLHEPPNHMRYLLSKPYNHWESIVNHIGLTTTWVELIKNCSFHRRIKIIQGNNDRYNKFSQLLALEYNDLIMLFNLYENIYDTSNNKWISDMDFAIDGKPSIQTAHRIFMEHVSIQRIKETGFGTRIRALFGCKYEN